MFHVLIGIYKVVSEQQVVDYSDTQPVVFGAARMENIEDNKGRFCC